MILEIVYKSVNLYIVVYKITPEVLAYHFRLVNVLSEYQIVFLSNCLITDNVLIA